MPKMPTLYGRLVQCLVPVVLVILWSSTPHPLTLRAEILSEADESAAYGKQPQLK